MNSQSAKQGVALNRIVDDVDMTLVTALSKDGSKTVLFTKQDGGERQHRYESRDLIFRQDGIGLHYSIAFPAISTTASLSRQVYWNHLTVADTESRSL
jgi:hypothetical protein